MQTKYDVRSGQKSEKQKNTDLSLNYVSIVCQDSKEQTKPTGLNLKCLVKDCYLGN